jgi:hypothetical protein
LDRLRTLDDFQPLKPNSLGHTFAECMARGAKIVDGHITPSGHYAIHVEMPANDGGLTGTDDQPCHGQRKSFSNLTAETILPYTLRFSQ